MKTITVTVAKDGSTKVETKGFSGSSCQAATEFLEKSLGTRRSEKLTAEYFNQQSAQLKLQEGTQA